MLRPRMTDLLLDRLGDRVAMFDPLLHNTASATIVRAGQSANVVPGEASVDIDCRLLPGQGPDDLFRELRALAGVDVELEVLSFHPGPPAPDMTMFDLLGDTLKELDPEARPVPLLLPAVTDARFFARLGIQTYGFLPMQLPADLPFAELIHAPDERIPVEALEFGTSAIHRVLGRLGGA
jgi:acetylornithine deacetylase/succinyl-diaminopimelate desuccinylase-like protein